MALFKINYSGYVVVEANDSIEAFKKYREKDYIQQNEHDGIKTITTVFYYDNDGECHEAEIESIDGDECIISFEYQTLRVGLEELDWGDNND